MWFLLVACLLWHGPALAEITTRAEKGAPLTHEELDENFITLQNWIYTQWNSWALEPTSTCTFATGPIPATGGAFESYLTCSSVAATSRLFTKVVAPVGWASGVLLVRGDAVDTAASPSGHVRAFHVAAQCYSAGSLRDNSWGVAQTLTIPFAVQHRQQTAMTAPITPSGTCTGSTEAVPVYVNIRLVINQAADVCPTSTDCKLTGLDILFVRP